MAEPLQAALPRELYVDEACRIQPLAILPATGDHRVACHLDAATVPATSDG